MNPGLYASCVGRRVLTTSATCEAPRPRPHQKSYCELRSTSGLPRRDRRDALNKILLCLEANFLAVPVKGQTLTGRCRLLDNSSPAELTPYCTVIITLCFQEGWAGNRVEEGSEGLPRARGSARRFQFGTSFNLVTTPGGRAWRLVYLMWLAGWSAGQFLVTQPVAPACPHACPREHDVEHECSLWKDCLAMGHLWEAASTRKTWASQVSHRPARKCLAGVGSSSRVGPPTTASAEPLTSGCLHGPVHLSQGAWHRLWKVHPGVDTWLPPQTLEAHLKPVQTAHLPGCGDRHSAADRLLLCPTSPPGAFS